MKSKPYRAACRDAPAQRLRRVQRHLLIGGIEFWIVAAGFVDAGLGVVRHQELGHATVKLKRSYVRAQPVLHLLIGGYFRVGVRTGAQHCNKQVAGLRYSSFAIVNRDRSSCPIDEHLLACFVLLAQHHIELAAPTLIESQNRL